jgi:uncharacterized protein (TIGR03437 family)
MTKADRMSWRSILICQVAILSLLRPGCRAAGLSVATQTASPGQTITVPLFFSAAGIAVAGIQFDLSWPSTMHVNIAPGAQLRDSSKLLFSNQLNGGALRCLIAGLNQDLLPDGELLRLLIEVDPAAPTGDTAVDITQVVASTPEGEAVPAEDVSTSINVQPAAGASLGAGSILSAASLTSGPLSPGEIVSIFTPYGSITPLTILVGGVPATLLYAGVSQLNAILPFGLNTQHDIAVELRTGDTTLAAGRFPAAPVSPGLFTQSADGIGPGAILNQDLTINSIANPAAPGSVIMVFGTGFGAANPPLSDGGIVASIGNFTTLVTAAVGGLPAEVTYAGPAPGLAPGAAQINIRLPEGVPENSTVPVLVTAGGVVVPNAVGVSVQ